jgi:indole-3-glycerol phosphate synthase
MSDFLDEMLAGARRRVAAARERAPLARPAHVGPPGRLRHALEHPAGGPPRDATPVPPLQRPMAVIAEVKRCSPSRGDIAPHLDAVAQARAYAAAGADAISVLTEPTRFGGSLNDLNSVTAAVELPVLRKDFIVDAYQIWEAAAAGAAAVLLIAAALETDVLAAMLAESHACGLDALVEAHDEDDLLRAELAGADLVGVNNRDLRTLTVDLGTTERLAALAPAGTLLVSESGIMTSADARRVLHAGAQAVLVGEALVRTRHDLLPAVLRDMRGAAAPALGATS